MSASFKAFGILAFRVHFSGGLHDPLLRRKISVKKLRLTLMMVAAMLLMVGVFTIPAAAQHTNKCPVKQKHQHHTSGPQDFCNDTTFHNERTDSAGDNHDNIIDIGVACNDCTINISGVGG